MLGKPVLHQALLDSRSVIFGKGSRRFVSTVLLIFQDDKSSSNVEEISIASKYLRDYGVKIITISVGSNATTDLGKVTPVVIDGTIHNLTKTIEERITEGN